jgi:exo-beta-1,3-glucanase (GH17 family)
MRILDPADTNVANQQSFTENVLKYARSAQTLANTVYLFEAYDESWKPGDLVEKHWGLYTEADRQPKFNFDIRSYSRFRN